MSRLNEEKTGVQNSHSCTMINLNLPLRKDAGDSLKLSTVSSKTQVCYQPDDSEPFTTTSVTENTKLNKIWSQGAAPKFNIEETKCINTMHKAVQVDCSGRSGVTLTNMNISSPLNNPNLSSQAGLPPVMFRPKNSYTLYSLQGNSIKNEDSSNQMANITNESFSSPPVKSILRKKGISDLPMDVLNLSDEALSTNRECRESSMNRLEGKRVNYVWGSDAPNKSFMSRSKFSTKTDESLLTDKGLTPMRSKSLKSKSNSFRKFIRNVLTEKAHSCGSKQTKNAPETPEETSVTNVTSKGSSNKNASVSAKSVSAKSESGKSASAKSDSGKSASAKSDSGKSASAKSDSGKSASGKSASAKSDSAKSTSKNSNKSVSSKPSFRSKRNTSSNSLDSTGNQSGSSSKTSNMFTTSKLLDPEICSPSMECYDGTSNSLMPFISEGYGTFEIELDSYHTNQNRIIINRQVVVEKQLEYITDKEPLTIQKTKKLTKKYKTTESLIPGCPTAKHLTGIKKSSYDPLKDLSIFGIDTCGKRLETKVRTSMLVELDEGHNHMKTKSPIIEEEDSKRGVKVTDILTVAQTRYEEA